VAAEPERALWEDWDPSRPEGVDTAAPVEATPGDRAAGRHLDDVT
jgi:hypothetical protein